MKTLSICEPIKKLMKAGIHIPKMEFNTDEKVTVKEGYIRAVEATRTSRFWKTQLDGHPELYLLFKMTMQTLTIMVAYDIVYNSEISYEPLSLNINFANGHGYIATINAVHSMNFKGSMLVNTAKNLMQYFGAKKVTLVDASSTQCENKRHSVSYKLLLSKGTTYYGLFGFQQMTLKKQRHLEYLTKKAHEIKVADLLDEFIKLKADPLFINILKSTNAVYLHEWIKTLSCEGFCLFDRALNVTLKRNNNLVHIPLLLNLKRYQHFALNRLVLGGAGRPKILMIGDISVSIYKDMIVIPEHFKFQYSLINKILTVRSFIFDNNKSVKDVVKLTKNIAIMLKATCIKIPQPTAYLLFIDSIPTASFKYLNREYETSSIAEENVSKAIKIILNTDICEIMRKNKDNYNKASKIYYSEYIEQADLLYLYPIDEKKSKNVYSSIVTKLEKRNAHTLKEAINCIGHDIITYLIWRFVFIVDGKLQLHKRFYKALSILFNNVQELVVELEIG